MIREFYLLVMVLLLFLSVVIAHYSLFDRLEATNSQLELSRVVKMPLLALSVGYLESQKLFDDDSNTIYPQMQEIDRMGFVYEK